MSIIKFIIKITKFIMLHKSLKGELEGIMGKKLTKFITYLLVIALLMQESTMTAMAANSDNDAVKIASQNETDELETLDDEEKEPEEDDGENEGEKDKNEEEGEEPGETDPSEKEEPEESNSDEPDLENPASEEVDSEQADSEDNADEEDTLQPNPKDEDDEDDNSTPEPTKPKQEEEDGSEPVINELAETDENGDLVTLGDNLLPEDIFKEADGVFSYWNTTQYKTNITSVNSADNGKSVIISFGNDGLGGDYLSSIYLTKDDFKLDNGHSYQVSYNITSTVNRDIKSGFDDTSDRDKHQISLTADKQQEVSYTITTNGEWNKLMFYMGIVGNTAANIGPHTITISDLAIRELIVELVPGPDDEDVEGNLLKNGTFVDGSLDNWSTNRDFGTTVKTASNRVAFDIPAINNSAQDYQIWLQQTVALDSIKDYKIAFDVTSSIDRSILVGFDQGPYLPQQKLEAGKQRRVEGEITGTVGGSFVICLGSTLRAYGEDARLEQDLAAHRVSISNVSITEIPKDMSAYDTPNDVPYTKITSLKDFTGYTAEELNPLKDGNFTRGLANWETWCEEWMTTWDVVKYAPVEDGMSVYIENTGGGEGNKPWDVQMNQNITLAKKTEYVLSFKVHSDAETRAIRVNIADIDNGENWVKPITIQKGETREVILNLPKLAEDANDKKFSIEMGNVAGDVQKNTLTFTDMKLEVNGYGELAERITDGYFDDGTKRTFETAGTADVVTYDFAENYVQAEISKDCSVEDVSVSSAPFSMLAGNDLGGNKYEASFMAGATTEERDIKAVLVNGNGTVLTEQTFSLSTDAKLYSFTYTPTAAQAGVRLKLLLGGTTGTVCVDTIRCDLAGYPRAMGLDVEAHDITLLERKVTPAINETPASKAIEGSDIVLTIDKGDSETAKKSNQAYVEAVKENGNITIDGNKIEKSQYTIAGGGDADYTITLEKSLFSVSGDRQTFDIRITVPWYKNVHIRQTVYKTQKWQGTWLEEFDGTALDTSKWSYQIGDGSLYGVAGWGNGEQQYYTEEGNLKVEDGELTITARKERKEGSTYTSARIWTMADNQKTAKFSQTYGRMEAKMKLAGGAGYEGVWPAFWMLPVDTSIYGTWPLSGEIDILEARGREPEKADGTVHYGKPWPNNESQGGVFDFTESRYNNDSDINDYHVYAVEWEPGDIRWYVDDELYYQYSNWYSQSSNNPQKYLYPAPFDQDFYIILNLAVGGTFDNGYEPDPDKLPVDMKVDYVRVYESATGYNEVAEEPPVTKDDDTSINSVKSELYDKEYRGINYVATDSDVQLRDVWNLVTLPQFNGHADFDTVTENGEVFAKITPTALGSESHAIQLIQALDLVKGYNYRISFDAKTEGGTRKLNMKLGQDGTEGWNAYETFETTLTNNVQHYQYEFQAGVTDLHSRVEFNLATSNLPVYIGNITYEIIDEIVIDEDGRKTPLDDGNHVYNGSFNIGGISGLSYWHTDDSDAKVVRTENKRGYQFTATKGNLYQYGLQLLQSDSYKLTFSANADADRTVKVIVSNNDGSVIYKSDDITLTKERGTKELTFTMEPDVTDEDAKLTFLIGESGEKVYITDIKLIRTSYNNVNWDEHNAHPLLNGDFESGDRYWTSYGAAEPTIIEDSEKAGNHYVQVNGKKSGNVYDLMLMYPDLALTGKTDYEFSFDVKASQDNETLLVTMEDVNYTHYFDAKDLAVGTEWTTYSYDLRYTDDLNVTLKFQLGGASGDCYYYFDNVKLSAKGAPKTPGILSARSYNLVGGDVIMTYTGEDDWVENAFVYVDGTKVDKSKAVFADGTLTIDKSVFTESKAYGVTVKSAGYTTSREVKVNLFPADGNRIFNGGFNSVLDPWGTYILEGKRDYITIENGEAKIHYGGPGYDEYGNIVPWAIQLYQDNIPVERGKKYQISFIAYATTARQIQVMRNQGGEVSDYVSITKEPQVYEVEFVSLGDTLKLQFLLSTIGKDGAGATIDDVLEDHDIYIDSVCVKEVGADGKVTVDNTELLSVIAQCGDITEQGDYTDESWEEFTTALESARVIAADKDAKQAQVDSAKDRLNAALKGLAHVADKSTLQGVLEKYKYVTGDETNKRYQAFKEAYDAAAEISKQNSATQTQVNRAIAELENAYDVMTKAAELDRVIAACEAADVDTSDENYPEYKTALEAAKKIAAREDAAKESIERATRNLQAAYEALTGEKLEITDRSALTAILARYENVEGDEADANYQRFKAAYDRARGLVTDATATQTDIDGAVKAVKDTYLAYVRALLETDVNEYEDMEQNAYTDDTWNAFTEALEKAQKLLENDSEEDTETAAERLVKAREDLQAAHRNLTEKDDLWIKNIPAQTYTGSAIKPAVEVWEGNQRLTEKKDYTVSYKKNTNAGQAEVIVTGKGNYKDKATVNFTILPKNIAELDVADVYAIIKNGKVSDKPKVTVKYGKKTVTLGDTDKKDCKVTYPEIPTVTTDDGKTSVVAGNYPITIEARNVKDVGEDGNETVTYTGNYAGKKEIRYAVLAGDTNLMSKASIMLSVEGAKVNSVKYAGVNGADTVKPDVTITYGSGNKKVTLIKDIDYTLEYVGWDKVGKATVEVKAIAKDPELGDENTKYYYGTKTATYTVKGETFKAGNITIDGFVGTGYTYTGDAIMLAENELVLKDKNRKDNNGESYTLERGRDYQIFYSNNINAGKKASIIFEGMGSYAGSKITKNFTIDSLSLETHANEDSGLVWSCPEKAVYTKTGAVPAYTLTYRGDPLTVKTDYTVSYSGNKVVKENQNSATIKINGKGNFSGTLTASYEVTKLTTEEINAGAVYAEATDIVVPNKLNKLKTSLKVYEKSTGKMLKQGTDYEKAFTYHVEDAETGEEVEVTADDLVPDQKIIVSVTLKNNYSGTGEEAATIKTSFRLYNSKQKASGFQVVVDNNDGDGWYYTSRQIRPGVTVYKSKASQKANEAPLVEGVDYEVDYTNNIQKGTAKIMITGTGNGYGGTKTVTFKIKNKTMFFKEWGQSIANFFSNLF